MKKYFVLFCSITFLMGCKDDGKKDRLYLKEIPVNGKTIEWFYYSNVSFTSADYLLLNDSINNKSDTILKSTNLKDVSFSNNNIMLYFYGKPRIYDDTIAISRNIGGFNIKIDTTAVPTGPTGSRESYQKK